VRLDPHSYADSEQPQTRSIDLSLRADFAARVLDGEIALHFRAPGEGPLDLDTRALTVRAVTALDGAPLRHELFAAEPILGARLRVELPAGTRGVRVRYSTSPAASALQWLDEAQTSGKQPFLYSQSQPIHAPPATNGDASPLHTTSCQATDQVPLEDHVQHHDW